MAKRGRRGNESFLETLVYAPWWVSLALLIVGNIGIRLIVPSLFEAQAGSGPLGGAISAGVNGAMPFIANMFTLVMLAALSFSLIRTFYQARKERSLEAATCGGGYQRQSAKDTAFDLNSNTVDKSRVSHQISSAFNSDNCRPAKLTQDLLNEIEWKRFEVLCSAAISALGLIPKETQYGADGGIDIVVSRNEASEPIGVVQCKAGEDRIVGIKPVRELLGVMAHGSYKQGMFITTGRYTQEAIDFAQGKIVLVTGDMLIAKINGLPQDQLQNVLNIAFEGDYRIPTCPKCGVKMVLRESGKGRSAGNSFWGCVHYPRCRQTLVCKSEPS